LVPVGSNQRGKSTWSLEDSFYKSKKQKADLEQKLKHTHTMYDISTYHNHHFLKVCLKKLNAARIIYCLSQESGGSISDKGYLTCTLVIFDQNVCDCQGNFIF
jgi:hypothetical protein